MIIVTLKLFNKHVFELRTILLFFVDLLPRRIEEKSHIFSYET